MVLVGPANRECCTLTKIDSVLHKKAYCQVWYKLRTEAMAYSIDSEGRRAEAYLYTKYIYNGAGTDLGISDSRPTGS